MTELLLFKHDHTTQGVVPNSEQFATLVKPFDLVTAQPDGWGWGAEELSNPWFRIAAWPALAMADAEQFLSPLLPLVDVNQTPTTYRQYRGFYMLMTHTSLPPALRTWWNDDTREVPIYRVTINVPGPVITNIKRAHPHIPTP